jgi:hypothetical protein
VSGLERFTPVELCKGIAVLGIQNDWLNPKLYWPRVPYLLLGMIVSAVNLQITFLPHVGTNLWRLFLTIEVPPPSHPQKSVQDTFTHRDARLWKFSVPAPDSVKY